MRGGFKLRNMYLLYFHPRHKLLKTRRRAVFGRSNLRIIIQVCFVLSAIFVVGSLSSPATAADETYEQMRACLDSVTQGDENAGQAWWDRRDAEQQRYMRELPCEEKYIVAVCVFLYDPDLKACTNRGVARYRGDRHCATQGHEILSESKAACMRDYESNFQGVF